MLDKQFITTHLDEVKQNIAERGLTVDLESFVRLDGERRELIAAIEDLRATKNATSKSKPTEEEIEQMKVLGKQVKELEEKLEAVQGEYLDIYKQIPNMRHPDSPVGGEDDAHEIEVHGNIPDHEFTAMTHDEILEKKGAIDFKRGAKVVGSKFYYAKGDLVRLNQALIGLGMDIATKHGYTLVETPDMAKNEISEGIGYQPRGEETQIYSIENTELSLVGTAEITMGGYHADEVLDFANGPKKYVALSHCYRTEAGSYGRTSKGLYRVHQFTKLELFVFCEPNKSEELHKELLTIEKEIADALELSYHVVDIASGDLGAPAYRKFDLEAWMSMKKGFGEITSASNCTDYQARRLNITYKDDEGNRTFVHTLNGTAIVSSRMPIAIIEQHQQDDGSVAVPKALQPYLGGKTHLFQ